MENNPCTNMFLINMGADLGIIIMEDGIYIQKRVIYNRNGGIELPYNYLSDLHDVSCLEDCFVFCGWEPGFMGVDEKFFEIHSSEIESEKARNYRNMRLAMIMDIEDGEDFYSFFRKPCTNIKKDNIDANIKTRIISIEDFDNRVLDVIYGGDYEMEFKEDGEVMIRTKIYKWSDNSLHSQPEMKG